MHSKYVVCREESSSEHTYANSGVQSRGILKRPDCAGTVVKPIGRGCGYKSFSEHPSHSNVNFQLFTEVVHSNNDPGWRQAFIQVD